LAGIARRCGRCLSSFRARLTLAAGAAVLAGNLAAAGGVDALTRTSPQGTAVNAAAGAFLLVYLGLVAAAAARAVLAARRDGRPARASASGWTR
jgi:hypothetical protein